MKIFKKICGFLCVGVVSLVMNNVSAADYDIEFPDKINIKNGEFTMSIGPVNAFLAGTNFVGDANQDGKVTLDDVSKAYKCYFKQDVCDITYTDTDGDGVITLTDVYNIQQMAQRIQKLRTVSNSTITERKLSSDDIKSLKYMVINGDSELYEMFDNFYKKVGSFDLNNITDEQIKEFKDGYANLQQTVFLSKYNHLYETSTDNKTIKGSLGTKEVENIYIVASYDFNNADSEGATGITQFMTYKVSSEAWEFLHKNETKVEGTTVEETVENPNTMVAISVIGLAIIAIAGTVVAKKKNLFSRI